jgi:2,3-dimethylmalate lyase
MSGAERIRRLVCTDTVLMPGVYDALTARIAARIGFEVVFISGYSVSAARLGEPDFGLLTGSEMTEAARSVCRVSSAPVIVDADTGYGNPLNVIRTVREFQDAGAAGVFLEDQVWPKKCGHMAGKRVVDVQEHASKIRAACDARG